MDEDQLKWILADIGVVNPEDMVEITKMVRCIEFNNNTAIFIDPLDQVNKLVKINYEKRVLVFKYMNRGRWKTQYKAFADLEAVIDRASTIPDNYKGGVIENDDGSYWDFGKSANNQDFIVETDMDPNKPGVPGIFKKDTDGRPIPTKNYSGNIYSNLPR